MIYSLFGDVIDKPATALLAKRPETGETNK
jgi:hypothetical protein